MDCDDSSSGRKCEAAMVLVGFLAANALGQAFQRPISIHQGQGIDGVAYCQVAGQLARGEPVHGPAPHVYRIGTPFLASWAGAEHVLAGFKVANLLAAAISVVLLTIWLRRFTASWQIRVIVVSLFVFQWHGPPRFVYYYPATTDAWFFVFALAGLLGTYRFAQDPDTLTAWYLVLVTLLGIMFREVSLAIPIATCFATNPIRFGPSWHVDLITMRWRRLAEMPPYPCVLPLLFGSLGLLLTHWAVNVEPTGYSFVKTAIDYALWKSAFSYFYGWFVTYGPILIVAVYGWRSNARFLANHQDLLVWLLIFSVLGWIGGTDTERMLYWAMPVVYVLIARSMEENWSLLRGAPIAVLLLLQSIAERVFWVIPDYPSDTPTPMPWLTILSSDFQMYDLYSYFTRPRIRIIALTEYLAISIGLLWWLSYRRLQGVADLAGADQAHLPR
jgi:hypothetical protein